jgi:hypothetical protein
MRLEFVILIGLLGIWFSGEIGAQELTPTPGDKTPVKSRQRFSGIGGRGYCGVVEKIDEDSMTVRKTDPKTGEEKSYVLYALDLHTEGKHPTSARGATSYLWADVKKGDTVDVTALEDRVEKREYVTDLMVERRPGAKLPQSQQPLKDRRYARASLLNDIDNGEDVSDADIVKQFPPVIDPENRQILVPGGLPMDYLKKLAAIRSKLEEKKEKDPKAPPPEKK